MTDTDPRLASLSGSTQFNSRARIFFIFTIDLGFLVDQAAENAQARRRLTALRATGLVTDEIFHAGTVSLRFGNLREGKRESDTITDRSRQAEDSGGKAIWSSTLLAHEAPYLFTEPPVPNSTAVQVEGTHGVRFERGDQKTDCFRVVRWRLSSNGTFHYLGIP